MKLFGWLKRSGKDDLLADWRARWTRALENPEDADVKAMRGELEAAERSGADVEVEAEMLDALEQLIVTRTQAASGSLPLIATQHRVVGMEPCHFTAPVSLPADPSQASGRLLVTPGRAIFVGGGRTSASAWSTVHRIVRVERDVLLLRADETAAAHFRFNTFGDALVAAFLAQHFRKSQRTRL